MIKSKLEHFIAGMLLMCFVLGAAMFAANIISAIIDFARGVI